MGDIYRIRELGYLQKAMDMRVARSNAISANIANVSTPGYKAVSVEFDDQLKAALGDKLAMTETDHAHLPNHMQGAYGIKPEFRVSAGHARVDGSNVNLDTEFTAEAQNTISYAVLASAARKHLSLLFTAFDDKTK